MNQSFIPITIRRLLPNVTIPSKYLTNHLMNLFIYFVFRISFFNEISLLVSLCHPHILHAYGFSSEPSFSLLTESSDVTTVDLYQYLHHQHAKPLLHSTVLFFARQISSALAYLESLQISHRDLAARNCLISSNLHLKLQDLAMCNELYADDYAFITLENQIQTRRPIRWCAWETICLVRELSQALPFSK